MPRGLSVREFDKRLHHAMRNAALNPWLMSPVGQAHCRMIGEKPETLVRGTAYGFGASQRPSTAQEFYLSGPKSRDADRLIRIVEVIVHNHVMNPNAAPAVGWKSKGQGFGEMKSGS